MESLKELLTPKTFNKLSIVGVIFWFLLGVTLFGIFADIENSESRFDFRCDAKLDKDSKDFIRGKCFDEYEKEYNKLSIFPVYGLVIINFSVIGIVSVVYSQCVKSTVDELETHMFDVEEQRRRRRGNRKSLFVSYCCQLASRFALAILFIVLRTHVLYPSNFPSNFNCNLTKESTNSSAYSTTNSTQTQSYECHNPRATKKTFWTNAVAVVNGIYAFLALIEFVWILSRARNGKNFLEDSQFYDDHLQANQSRKLKATIQSMKDNIIAYTKKPVDLKQLIRPNPGEGPKPKDLDIDDIFVNLVIHEGRASYEFPDERRERLIVYPKPNAKESDCRRAEYILDGHHNNVLVVGRPGIGKTMLCTKLLQISALNSFKYVHFHVAFLIQFRRFNNNYSETNLDLHELLARTETVHCHLDDEVWKHINRYPTKVLFVFDGIDEFSAKSDIAIDHSGFKDTVNEKMPIYCLYNKIASGKLLPGATVVTTTRPTAVSCVRQLNFDRTIEILGFSPEQVKDYVDRYVEMSAEGECDPDAKETIWQHISTNINLFSLCYIPMNCFIICSCLSLMHACGSRLPTKLTKIYSIAMKIFYFRHSDRYRHSGGAYDQFIFKKFHELPSPVVNDFKRLGQIAYDGITEGRLIFASREVKGLEDCGLLHRLPDLAGPTPLDPSEGQFCFMHLTLQEFLAAKHVIDTKKEAGELQKFVTDHINLGGWQVVMQFVAGLLEPDPVGEMPNSDIFSKFLPMSVNESIPMGFPRECEEHKTLRWWPANKEDKDVAVILCNCLYELDVNEQSTMANTVSTIGFNAADFSDCRLAPVDCTAIVHFLKNAYGILCLNLQGNNIGWLGCIEINKWIVDSRVNSKCDCKLNSLNLKRNQVGDKGAAELCEALKHKNCKLHVLNLSDDYIGDEGAAHLCDALKAENCELTWLTLYGNHIGDKGAAYLSDALKDVNCELTVLDLADNDIGDKGAAHLSVSLKNANCKLSKLYLDGNHVGDKGAEHLSKALRDGNCNLFELNLSGNNIGDKGAAHLSDTLEDENCKLCKLYLDGNLPYRGQYSNV